MFFWDYDDHMVDDDSSGESVEDVNAESSEDEGAQRKKRAKLDDSVSDGSEFLTDDDEDEGFGFTIAKKFDKVLSGIVNEDGNGEFAVSGQLIQAPFTVISLNDGTIIRFPIQENEVDELVGKFEQSPFGRGEETVLDTNVRNSWQLDPSNFKIVNPEWSAFINESVVPMVKKDLAIRTPFTANLYKLLLYKTGSFFLPHRDTEKEDQMFGTLVIQFPSEFTGGQLVLKHDGKTRIIDFSTEASESNQFKTFYSAFYCDCEHEILQLTRGVRASLIYNLALLGQSADLEVPKAPIFSGFTIDFGKLMDEWRSCNQNQIIPKKLVYVLSHRYSAYNLRVDNLKGGDKSVALILKSMAKDYNLTAMLGILEVSKEYLRGVEDDEDIERYYSVQKLRIIAPEESLLAKTSNGIDLEKCLELEIFPRKRVEDLKPYNKTSEYTGNEGFQVTKQYHRAAILIFKNETVLDVLSKDGKGSNAVEEIFLSTCKRLADRPEPEEALITECKTLAKIIVDRGDDYPHQMLYYGQKKSVDELFKAFLCLKSTELISKFLSNYKSSIVHCITTMTSLLGTLVESYGWSYFVQEFENILKHIKDRKTSIEVVTSLCNAHMNEERKGAFHNFLTLILNELKGDDRKYQHDRHNPLSMPIYTDQLQIDLLFHFCILAKQIGFCYQEYATSKPYYITVPCLIELAEKDNNMVDSSWLSTTQHFLPTLEAISNKKLDGPDPNLLIRGDFVPCKDSCQDCSAMQYFMKSVQPMQRFTMGEKRRRHLERYTKHMTGILLQTERSGRPFTLVVTKLLEAQLAANMKDKLITTELLGKLNTLIQSNNRGNAAADAEQPSTSAIFTNYQIF